jgi:hypothetical protein
MTASEAKSIEELRRYGGELAARRVEDDPVVKNWRAAKRIVWMLSLAGAFLFYYLIDKLQEALAILR